MSLSLITKNEKIKPPKIIIYGGAGIGKTTFAAKAPNPIFLCTEDGLGLNKVDMFPLITNLRDINLYLASLIDEDNDYKTVVIDSIDWLDECIRKEVLATTDKKDLTYGNDQKLFRDVWGKTLGLLSRLNNEKNMLVILIAHHQLKRYDSPLNESYDRHIPKLNQKCGEFIMEWCDAIFFATPEIRTISEDKGFGAKTIKGVSSGQITMHTRLNAGFIAKNRWGLPAEMPFDFMCFINELNKKIKGE